MPVTKNSPQNEKRISLERLGIFKKYPPKPQIKRAKSYVDHTVDQSFSANLTSTVFPDCLITSEHPKDLQSAMEIVRKQNWRTTSELKSQALGFNVTKFRSALPKCVLKSQLIGLYRQNLTFLERELFSLTNTSQVRMIFVNTGLGGEVIVDSNFFFQVMKTALGDSGCSERSIKAFQALKQLLESRPTATSLTETDLQSAGLMEDCRLVVNSGFLTLSNRANQDKSFMISMPNIGTLMRLVKLARKWIIDAIKQGKSNTMLETSLHLRWVNSKDYWIKFKGLDLSWALLDCYGGGWCEPFVTSVGLHWKLSGKKL